MLEKIWKNVHNLEDLLVECAEMYHFTKGINRLLINKNDAYLKKKEAEENEAAVDLTQCEMYRYLSAM